MARKTDIATDSAPTALLLNHPAGATSIVQGLSTAEAAARRQRGLGNGVNATTSRTYGQIVRQNAFTFINVVLFAISAVLVALGLYGDALATAGLVLLNVVIAVFQEARAKRTLDRIALLTRPEATVIRDGQERRVAPSAVVLGDVLVLRPGDQVVADGTVVGDGTFDADESLLTGEADPVRKVAGDPVYSGSFCVNGTGRYEARQVGAASFANRLTEGARAFRQVKTPLQQDLDLIIRIMILLVVAVSAPVVLDLLVRLVELASRAVSEPLAAAVAHAYQGFALEGTVQAAAVVVALVPQGLALMIAVTYGTAALRLAGKGALIQQANAVESLSHVNVLCLDKTGTLTTNRLRVEGARAFGVTEAAFERALGEFVASAADQNRTAAAIAAAYPAAARPVLAEVPFSSARKWSGLTLAEPAPGETSVLGALEVLGPLGQAHPDVANVVAGWADQGLRVLVFARCAGPCSLHDDRGEPLLPGNLEPWGAIALRDELRPEARATLRAFADAGVAVKIISGDDPRTVAALAQQAGLPPEARAVAGGELPETDDARFVALVLGGTIFGRITPRQKERIVRVLRRQGHYVAMTGDGVNDVLALKQADLAIAVRSGSQAARAVADLVLLHDSFAVLPAAFREGQRIVGGMQDIVKLFLVRSLAVAGIIVGAAIAGAAFPVTPKHNALLALVTVGIPTFALALWARPVRTQRRLLPRVLPFVLPAALTITPVALAVFLYGLRIGGDLSAARTALTTAAVFCGLVLLPFVQPPTRWWVGGDDLSGDWRPTALALALGAAYLGLLAWPAAHRIFALAALGLGDLLVIAVVVVLWVLGLRWIWRGRLFERLLGFADDLPASDGDLPAM